MDNNKEKSRREGLRVIMTAVFAISVLFMVCGSPAYGEEKQPLFDRVSLYIADSWDILTRNAEKVSALKDTKAGSPILYVPEGDFERVSKKLKDIDVRPIKKGTAFTDIKEHGLLYLPYDYVVPGGRFNEMYGWDSYFIILGLLQSGRSDKAEGMVRNMFYQIDNYGKVLNANRTYYISRSSPPFQSRAVLGVYEKTKDKEFLKEGIDHVIKEYNYWTNPGTVDSPDHLTPTGLSRYYSPIGVPCPEVEPGYYQDHNLPVQDPEFCRNDRGERESGWDMSDRFEYRITEYNPVDLNSYLYMFEKDLATMYRIMEGENSLEAGKWDQKALKRKELINTYCWDESAGMFYDYNFKTDKRSCYDCLATFTPLWAGIASPEQAKRVMENLKKFETPYGLVTSTTESGKQWDSPSGWAPLQILAVTGMRNYGYDYEADRVSVKFLAVIMHNFDQVGGILEKYNMKTGTGEVQMGYGNQIGFGWTNAAFLELYDKMSERAREELKSMTD